MPEIKERNGLGESLEKTLAEAIAVSIFEYDEEKHIRNEKAISYETGYEEGHELREEHFSMLAGRLLSDGRISDLEKSVRDISYRRKLYEECGIQIL